MSTRKRLEKNRGCPTFDGGVRSPHLCSGTGLSGHKSCPSLGRDSGRHQASQRSLRSRPLRDSPSLSVDTGFGGGFGTFHGKEFQGSRGRRTELSLRLMTLDLGRKRCPTPSPRFDGSTRVPSVCLDECRFVLLRGPGALRPQLMN